MIGFLNQSYFFLPSPRSSMVERPAVVCVVTEHGVLRMTLHQPSPEGRWFDSGRGDSIFFKLYFGECTQKLLNCVSTRKSMNIDDFKKFVKNFSETNMISDEPHVSMRCEENNILLENVKKTILDPRAKLIRLVEDRPRVYKLYYFISKKKELKIVIDLWEHNTINIRTVKILSSQFRIGTVKRRRF